MERERDSAFMKLVRARRSIRRFLKKQVGKNLVLSCIEAALHAPSTMNSQPWSFVVLDEPDEVSRFVQRACTGIYRPTRWIASAPVVLAIVVEKKLVPHWFGPLLQGTAFSLLDVGIAGQHIVLRATELGLGTCWIGWFSAKGAARALGVPASHRVAALVVLGWADPAFPPRPKAIRNLHESTHFSAWQSVFANEHEGF
jgi:nitroreductase